MTSIYIFTYRSNDKYKEMSVLLFKPLEEVASSSIGVDCGESLKTAGDVWGEWWLADIF